MSNESIKQSLTDLLKSDNERHVDYPDEAIASNLFLISFCVSLRELKTRLQKCIEYIDTLPNDLFSDFSYDKKELSEAVLQVFACSTTEIDKCKVLIEKLQSKYGSNKSFGVIDNFLNCISKNLWINSKVLVNIKALNFDIIKNRCNITDAQSMDALILDYEQNKNNSLIEFKNCEKSYLLKKFLNPKSKSEKDSIYKKVSCSKNILRFLNIYGYDASNDIIKRTYVILVYSKNDIVSVMPTYRLDKRFVIRDENNKQISASSKGRNKKASPSKFNIDPHPSKTLSVCDKHGKQMKATDHISVKDYNEYVVAFEKFVQLKGFGCCLFETESKGAKKSVLILGENDFVKASENGMIQSSNWGIYSSYIND